MKKEITGWYHYHDDDYGLHTMWGTITKTSQQKNITDNGYIGDISFLLKEFHDKKIKITVEVLDQ